MSSPTSAALSTARARIADSLQLDGQGRLVQRREHLNLAGLNLTEAELTAPFAPQERGLPELSLADLPHLRYLDLTGNQLTKLPECVTRCRELVWLGLNFNQLATLPERIGELRKLQRFYVRGNVLTTLPDGMGKLTELRELDLTGNRIGKLSSAMGRLAGLEHLALEEASLEPDLRAAWKGGQWPKLREHLQSVAAEQQAAGPLPSQCVGKVVLVGSQENGKTCLQRALRGEPFVAGQKSTDGMSRERLHLTLDGSLVSPKQRAKSPGPQADVIDLMLWDMGGQESYQHTHQMFFTPSAIYVVVTLPRLGGGVQKLDDWIGLVKRRTGGEATVIVVSTWCGKHPPDKALSLVELQAKHGEMIRAVVAVDSEDGAGIPELRRLLATVVQEPRAKCRHTWLRGWAAVLDELSSSTEAYLRWKAVQAICAAQQIGDEEEQRRVIRTGHYTGALLWREDIPAGEDVVILNPDWLSRAVARLLDDEKTRKAHGLVHIPKLDRVWSGPGRDGTTGYPPESFPALIELMEINELAYRPKVKGEKTGEGEMLLITQLVEDLPKHDVEAEWRKISPAAGAQTVRVVAFRKVGDLGYGEVPDIIYLLIFRLREFSLGRTDYEQAVHWQRGLLVRDDYGGAGRIELEDGKLRITVRHRLGDGLMHSIIHRIGVHDDGYWNGRGLEKVEFVPCGKLCPRNTPEAGLIAMESCVKADRVGNKSVECKTCREYLPIQALLGQQAVETNEMIALRNWLEPFVRAELGEVSRKLDQFPTQFAELRGLIRMQGDGILDAFTSEWKEGPRLFSLIPVLEKGWNPKRWSHMTFRVTVWCEASRQPVPFFRVQRSGKSKAGAFKGSELVTVTRDWVQSARKLLKWGSWAAFAAATGGAGAMQGLVTAAGGVVTSEDAETFAKELAKHQKTSKEILGAIPDESRSLLRGEYSEPDPDWQAGFPAPGRIDFGTPVEADKKLIRFLREEFKKQDGEWGGLVPRDDGKFGRIWAHPQAARE